MSETESMPNFMQPGDCIYIAGHRGLAGGAIHRALQAAGYTNLLVRTRAELDLRDPSATARFFTEQPPKFVFLAAAKVGGILANSTYPAEFIADNLAIQGSVIAAARHAGVARLLFLGSSCIYPERAPQPMPESCLLTGPLEPANRSYALAKIAGIEMCWACNRQYGTKYLAAMPTNLYGPGDNFDLASSHVLPALLRKAVEAKQAGAQELVVWGSGTPRREFLYADDLAEACLFLMNLAEPAFSSLLSGPSAGNDAPPLINIGVGKDVTIQELAELVAKAAGFSGKIVFDATRPDGTARKLLDVSRLTALGWRSTTSLEEGIERTLRAWQQVSTHPIVE